MTPDFAILLAATAAAAAGAAAALRRRPPLGVAVAVLLLYTFCGMHAVSLAMLSGDGRVLPGRQISPDIVRYWVEHLPVPHPGWLLGAVLAHAVLWMARPDRRGILLPLPATLIFVLLFFALEQRAESPGAILRGRALGPGRAAWLTQVPTPEGCRLVVSQGDPADTLPRLLLVHEAEGTPPRLRLYWTADGAGVIVSIGDQPHLALGIDGEVVGALPERASEWPQESVALEPTGARLRFSEAKRDVAEYLKRHGGIHAG